MVHLKKHCRLVSGLSFQDVAIVDINNDNFDDVIGMYSSTQFGAHISNGNGTFDPEVIYSAGSGAGGDREILVTDIDGDGDNDVIGLYMQDNSFSVHERTMAMEHLQTKCHIAPTKCQWILLKETMTAMGIKTFL
jgi:hypothetical protein